MTTEDGAVLEARHHPIAEAMRTGRPVGPSVIGIDNPITERFQWISTAAVPVFDQSTGALTQIYSTFEDITERKRAEIAVQEAERRFRSIWEKSADGMRLTDKDGVLRANDAPAFTPPDGQPQFTPRAKSVIWIFLIGGLSHLESFDVKPELNKYAGKLIEDTPHKGVVNDALVRSAGVVEMVHLPAHTVVRTMVTNDSLKATLAKYGVRIVSVTEPVK